MLGFAYGFRQLPKIDRTYRVGTLGWSDVREIVKVATLDVEDKCAGDDLAFGEELARARRCT